MNSPPVADQFCSAKVFFGKLRSLGFRSLPVHSKTPEITRVHEREYATPETFLGYRIASVSTSITDLNQAPANEPTVLVVN